MKKQKKQLFLLLGVLVFFVAAYFGLQAYYRTEANKEEEVEGVKAISMEYSDVELLQFTHDGEWLQFECVDGTWYVAGDHSQKVKQYRIETIVNGVASPLLAEAVIENVTDLSLYGLDAPTQEIRVGNDVEQYTIYVGDLNSMMYTYYVYLASDPTTVYSIGSADINRLDYGLSDFVEAAVEEESAPAEDETTTEGTAETSGEVAGNAGTSPVAPPEPRSKEKEL